MTVQQFSNFSPAPGSINFYYSGNTVSAITISSVDCIGNNVAASLSQLTSVKVSISGTSYILTITNVTSKNNYYFYTIEPVTVSSVLDKNCTESLLTPSPSETSFDSSDYNVLLNNATLNSSTGYIYDVDRTILSSTPVNYLAIMSGSATNAEYQELNYSSVGLINGRYVGSKTTRESYGTTPSIALSTFDGALYNKNIQDSRIYSQSLSERNVELLGLNSEFNVGTLNPDGQPTFTKNNNQFLYSGYISGSSTSPASLNTQNTTIQVDWRRSEKNKLQANGLYHFTTQTTEEFFILKSFELVTQKTVGSIAFNTYTMKVVRGIDESSYTHTAGSLTNYNINIKKVEADQIFQFDGNKISTVSNKKVYLPVKDVIVFAGKEGMIYSGSTP